MSELPEQGQPSASEHHDSTLCLFVYLFFCLFVCLYGWITRAYTAVCQRGSWLHCLFVSLFVYLFVCLFFCMGKLPEQAQPTASEDHDSIVCLFICLLFVYLFVLLLVCLFVWVNYQSKDSRLPARIMTPRPEVSSVQLGALSVAWWPYWWWWPR